MQVVLFDGVCNLCNGYVNWLIDHDKQQLFKFASLQSDAGKKLVSQLGLQGNYLDTIILNQNGKGYTHSTAVLHIVKQLGGVYRLAVVLFIIPAFIRNAVYNLVARNRYKWFGRQDSCRLPTPELKERFIE